MGDTDKTTVIVARGDPTTGAAVILPAAGAYDLVTSTTCRVIDVRHIDRVTFYFTYTRGAVGGQARVKIVKLKTSGATVGSADSSRDEASYAAGVVNLDRQYELTLPAATGAGAEETSDVYECEGDVFLKILAKEVGVVGTPGTLKIDWTGGDV